MPYISISNARSAGFPTKAEGIPMTIAQINKLASIYDAVKGDPKIKVPFSIAWFQWKKIYVKVGNKWVVRKAAEKSMDKKITRLFFPIEVKGFEFAEGDKTHEIQVLPIGTWNHDRYGRIKIAERDISQYVKNFNNGIRKDLPITEGHPVGEEEKPAIGWFKKLVNKGRDGLWAVIEWTDKGRDLLKEKAYQYFSPEFYTTYEDPETHKKYSNVLSGGALTNTPYFKGLQAVVLSEKNIFDETKMKIEEIVEKEVVDLTDEEKTFLKEKKEELTAEQKETYKDVIEEEPTDPEKTPLEKVLDKDVGDLTDNDKDVLKENKGDLTDDQKDTYKDVIDDGKQEGSEKMIQVSETALKMLEKKATEGSQAFTELKKTKAEHYVNSKTFSETNQAGPLLPKSRNKTVAFYLSLTEGQQKEFTEILAELPKAKLFSELGKESGVDIKASEEADTLAKALMEKDDKLTYVQALTRTFSENDGLEERVEQE